MRAPLRLVMLIGVLVMALGRAEPAAAQYLKLTTDNPTDNTRLRASGATLLTISLNTNHDKSGATQTCNSHTIACGNVGTANPLDIGAYTLTLSAVGGTVTWGAYSSANPAYVDVGSSPATNTQVEINFGRASGFDPAGLYTLGTISVTPTSGSPSIIFARGAQPINPFGFGTGFGTECDAFNFPNTYVLADPAAVCNTGDFTDADGAGAAGSPPTLNAIANMTIASGGCAPSTADQSISATDPDGDAIAFTSSGPSWMTVTSNAQVGNTRTGNIHLVSPPSGTVGNFPASVTATAAGQSDTKSFTIQVVIVNQAPVLAQPTNMTVAAPLTADQMLTATDACSSPLTFSVASGPTFMTVITTNPGTGTGNIHLAPTLSDQGTYSVSVRVTNSSGISDTKSFTITVTHADRPPVLSQPANMTVDEGMTADQGISANDPDADPITFSSSGPSFMILTSNIQVGTTRTGNVHLAPSFLAAGAYAATVTASSTDGSDTKSFNITVNNVNRPPTLNAVANMLVPVGATADQIVTGSDPDGDALTFSKASGPTFMTVTTTSPTAGNIHLAPGFADGGTFAATVRASDGSSSADRGFSITVCAGCQRAPVLAQPANMTVNEAATADQTLSATDADGNAITFSKASGPTFMTVTTTSPGIGTGTGNIHLAPGFSDQGTYAATVSATDGSLTDSKSFSITVNNACRGPVLNQPANMTVNAGATADQVVTGASPDGNPVTFSAAGPPYMTFTITSPTTGNIHLAPGASDAGTAVGSVTVTDATCGSSTKSFMITVTNNHPPVLNPIANMSNCGPADQTITGSDPDGDALTFSKVAGPSFMTVTTTSPTTGNIHVGFTLEPGTFPATARASDGTLSADQSFVINIFNACRAPTLNPVANMTVTEGMTADQTITASDPDAVPITFSKVSGPIFMTVSTTDPGAGSATGNIHLAPGLADAGTYGATVRASIPIGLTSARSFSITALTSGNRCPTANPGGPYSGVVGVPVSFNGSGSSDPDGNPLTYEWDFDASDGIQVDAVGVMASHVYTADALYIATLTVTDNGDGDPGQVCSDRKGTNVSILPACQATVFNGYDTIRLGSGKPYWFGYVQPATNCYANTDVIVSSFVMKYAGRQIGASANKTTVGGDKSGDGIQEIKVSFTKDDLRALFAGTGLPNGHNTVTVILEARLVTGGTLRGSTQLDVVNNGSFTISEVAPNPLNPSAILTYTTTRPGPVRIDMFDIQGRLVRHLVDEPALAAGLHEAKIDGLGQHGEKLPSGVYYIRGVSSEGVFKHLVTILK